MSLASLSTELDKMIVKHLYSDRARTALCALSLVSRYYHKLTEPLLYRSIEFGDNAEVCAKRLMMTLLDRSELALHIDSITLSACQDNDPFFTWTSRVSQHTELSYTTHLLRRCASKVTEMIDGFGLRSESLRRAWLANVFERMHDIYPEDPSFDGALAIIFALSTNARKASLGICHPGSLDITLQVLALHDRDHHSRPALCSKLAMLEILGSVSDYDTVNFRLPNAAQEVYIHECDVVSMKMLSTPQIALRRLELHYVCITSDVLESFIAQPGAEQLEYLSVDNLMDDGTQLQDENPIMSNLRRERLPCLKTLRCVGARIETSVLLNWILDSLNALQQLHTLHIDYNLLLLCLCEIARGDRVPFLPSSIMNIEVTDVRTSSLECLRSADEGKPLYSPWPYPLSIWQFLVEPTPVFALESFALIITPTFDPSRPGVPVSLEHLSQPTISRLKAAALAASHRGIRYRVFGDSADRIDRRQLLIEADATPKVSLPANEASYSATEASAS